MLACLAVALFAARAHATLTGTFALVPANSVVDLSAQGAVDWIKWGTFTEYAPDRKYGVTAQISDFTSVGTTGGGPYQYDDNFNGYAWSDGMPLASMTNTTTGVYRIGKSKGFQFTVPSDTRLKVLKVYVGAFAAKGTLTATLSDGGSYTSSAIDYTGNGASGVYTIQFASGSTNRTLTVKFLVNTMHDANYGNVTLKPPRFPSRL